VNQLGNNFMAHVITANGNPTGYATVAMPDGDPSTLTLSLLGLGDLQWRQLCWNGGQAEFGTKFQLLMSGLRGRTLLFHSSIRLRW
jgi:hypothetical protein